MPVDSEYESCSENTLQRLFASIEDSKFNGISINLKKIKFSFIYDITY